MKWISELSALEYIFIALFVLLYFAFFYRIFRASQKLHASPWSAISKFLLRTAYFVLFIIALMGPSFGQQKTEVKSVGKDIFLAVDLSQSMNAFDIQPTRLEKIKYELKNICKAFNSDRIGLIIFSSEAFVQCPLTFDQSASNLFIETLNPSLVPNAGTDFGPPLKIALNKLLSEESVANTKAKVITLISDGEDFGEETDEMIDRIKDEGIKLFTLGVGTSQGSRVPTENGGFKKNNQGQYVVSKLESKQLKSMAVNTGGKYFEINDSKNEVESLINEIESIEGELRDKRQIDVSANKYFYFLAIALFLMLLDLLIVVKPVKI